jgi:hypothetical protein
MQIYRRYTQMDLVAANSSAGASVVKTSRALSSAMFFGIWFSSILCVLPKVSLPPPKGGDQDHQRIAVEVSHVLIAPNTLTVTLPLLRGRG